MYKFDLACVCEVYHVRLRAYQDGLQLMGKRSHAGLSLLCDVDSSTSGFCAILSRNLVAQERSLSFTYGRPVESCSSLEQMYFSKRRASRINLFWSR